MRPEAQVAEKADGRLHEGDGSSVFGGRWTCDRHAETDVGKQNGTGKARRAPSGDRNIASMVWPLHVGLLGSDFNEFDLRAYRLFAQNYQSPRAAPLGSDERCLFGLGVDPP